MRKPPRFSLQSLLPKMRGNKGFPLQPLTHFTCYDLVFFKLELLNFKFVKYHFMKILFRNLFVLVFIIISCSDSEKHILKLPEKISIINLPDAQGSDKGKGFTCTGLFYDQTETKKVMSGELFFWVGNHGVSSESSKSKPLSSIVKIKIDNDVRGIAYAQKVTELDMSKITNYKTIQGVIVDKFDTLWFVSFGNVINVNKSGKELGRFFVKDANGLAYDELNDVFFIKVQSMPLVYITNRLGEVKNKISVHASIDQLFYDNINKILYGGIGANGKPSRLISYKVDSKKELAIYGTFEGVVASEGFTFVGDFLYYASDAYYHPASVDNLKINAIHKFYFKP